MQRAQALVVDAVAVDAPGAVVADAAAGTIAAAGIVAGAAAVVADMLSKHTATD
jgi:hypothetical protein